MSPGELENGSFNGSFLILNLGNNTVGLGNPCMFPTPPKSLHHRSIDGAHNNSISIGNTNASSNVPTEESPRGSLENRRTKMLSDESDDPDWVPGRRARKRSCSFALRAAKPKALSPPVGSNNSDISQRGFNGTTASGTGQPPQYLVGLLNFFGWKVLFRPGFNDYVYISPAGITFYSLPKAFETFLLGTSKYKEKLPVVSAGEFPLTSADNGKRVRETKRTNSAVGEGAAPSMSVECVNLMQFSQKPGKAVENSRTCTEDKCSHKQVKKIAESSCLIAKEAQTCNDDAQDERRNCKFRRSVRINGGAIIGRGSMDTAQTKAASCRAKREAVGDIVSEYPNNKVRKSNCRDMMVLGTDGRNQKCASHKKKLARVSRSRLGNRKSVPVDAEFNAENMVHENLAPSTPVDNNAVSGNFCANDKGSSGGDKKLGSSSITVSCQSIFSDDCAISGIRRSMRINGKHVPVNNELDCEMGADEGMYEHFEFATSRVAKKDKQKLTTSAENDEMDVSTDVSDDMQFKYSNTKNFDCQNSKPHRQLESHNSKKNCNEQIPISEISSAKGRKTVGKENLIGEKKRGNRACRLLLRRKGKDNRSPLETKYTVLSWLIDAGTLTENEKVMYVSKCNTTNILSGLATRVGVCCDCCKEVMSLLKFEAHAGSNLQQPWNNIFLMSGKTLLQCLKEAWDQKKMQNKVGVETVGIDDLDPSDDTCGVCADGGHLICCDGCPSTFHQECLMLKVLPEGCWYCPYCRCAICIASEHGLYRVPETSKLLICKQCGRKYHRKCSSGNDTLEMGLFCGKKCKKLANQLSDIIGVINHMEGGFSWSLLQIFGEDEAVCSHYRMPFILECNAKLAMALSVLNECFLPLIDRRTGTDMICQAVFSSGSRFNRLNFQGFYTMVLEKDGEIISVASLRFRGTNFAEMPFVGTRPIYQRQGMCRRLMQAVEQMLSSLHVEKLVIPAIPDLVETWTKSFSFKPLESALKDEIKNLSLVVFAETTMLEKPICSTEAQEEGDLQTNKIRSSATGAEEAKEQPGFCGTGWWTLSFTAANDAQHNSSIGRNDSIYCALSFNNLIKIRD